MGPILGAEGVWATEVVPAFRSGIEYLLDYSKGTAPPGRGQGYNWARRSPSPTASFWMVVTRLQGGRNQPGDDRGDAMRLRVIVESPELELPQGLGPSPGRLRTSQGTVSARNAQQAVLWHRRAHGFASPMPKVGALPSTGHRRDAGVELPARREFATSIMISRVVQGGHSRTFHDTVLLDAGRQVEFSAATI